MPPAAAAERSSRLFWAALEYAKFTPPDPPTATDISGYSTCPRATGSFRRPGLQLLRTIGMSISEQDLARVAELARIRLDEATVTEVTRRISDILAMIDQMAAVDTSGIAPMANPLDATQRLRADQITEADQRERFLAIAPLSEEGLYLVPRVIE